MGEAFDNDDRVLLDVDSRNRISLGDLAGGHRRFIAYATGGVITLEPVIVMTHAELALARNPALSAEIERALTDPSSLVQRHIRRSPWSAA